MSIEIKPIRSSEDHEATLEEVGRLWGAAQDTAEGAGLDILLTLIDAYEAIAFPIDLPDPIDAILFRMEQQGLSRKDLEPMIGSRGRVAEILGRKRPLSLEMIRKLVALGIPAEVLIQRQKVAA